MRTQDEARGVLRHVAPPPCTAIVLAGGKSGRMGRDKALLPITGRPMIECLVSRLRPHFDEVLIAANDPEKYGFLGVPIVPDRIQGQGPLMGIASSVEASRNELNFVTACDCPVVDIPFVYTMLRRAADCDCVVPVNADGYFEPLYAVYRKSALHAMWRTLHEGERRIRAIFPRCRTVYVPLPAEMPLENINTPEDFARLERRDELGGSITLLEPSRSGTLPR